MLHELRVSRSCPDVSTRPFMSLPYPSMVCHVTWEPSASRSALRLEPDAQSGSIHLFSIGQFAAPTILRKYFAVDVPGGTLRRWTVFGEAVQLAPPPWRNALRRLQ